MAKYNNYLLNKNAVLKREDILEDKIKGLCDIYSEELALICSEISEIRQDYIKKLDRYVKIFFKEMTDGKEIPSITYDANHSLKEGCTKEDIRNKYLDLYASSREREIKYGSTLYGIHKDDLKIEINGKDGRFYASQGQQRSLALAMKMAEGEISREATGEYPVFLLDDVLSELDEKRRQYVMSSIDKRQVIITTCEPSVFKSNNESFIRIKEGKRV